MQNPLKNVYMSVSVLFGVQHIDQMPTETRRDNWIPWNQSKRKLWVPNVDAKNQTWILWKSGKWA